MINLSQVVSYHQYCCSSVSWKCKDSNNISYVYYYFSVTMACLQEWCIQIRIEGFFGGENRKNIHLQPIGFDNQPNVFHQVTRAHSWPCWMLEPAKHAPAWLTSADACQLPGCLAGSGPRGQGTRMDGPSHWFSNAQMAHSVSRLHIEMGGTLMTGNDESANFHLLPFPSDTCGMRGDERVVNASGHLHP